jgi:hypothetical protein
MEHDTVARLALHPGGTLVGRHTLNPLKTWGKVLAQDVLK